MDEQDQLSRRERQIMNIVYARAGASAAEVVADLPDPPTRTAVRTMLRILEQKGHLKHAKRGREYVYRPMRPRKRAGRSALKRVIETFFSGSLEEAMAAHLTDPGTKLSPKELKRLLEMIRRAREEGR